MTNKYHMYSKELQDACNIDEKSLPSHKITIEAAVEQVKQMYGVRADSIIVCEKCKAIHFIQIIAADADISNLAFDEDRMVERTDFDLEEANRLFKKAEEEYIENIYKIKLAKMKSICTISEAIQAALDIFDRAEERKKGTYI